jgi:lysophospholipase L1-like esterase
MKLKVLAAALAGFVGASDAPGEAPFAREITAFMKADRAAAPPACASLFVGSSSFRLWNTLAADMAPRTVINRGFGGSHMAHVNRYFDVVVAPHRPREILLYEGENDLWRGVSVEAFVADFAAFMERKTAALGATPVYFVSIKPSQQRFDQLALQARANGLIAEMAAARDDLAYVDVVAAMLDEDGRPKDIFVADGLHMTAEGYAIWIPIIRAALDQGAPTSAPGC